MDWDTSQNVTVTGVDDPDLDGDVAYTIVTAAAVSTDPDYNGLNGADVSVTNIDDEGPPPITVDSVFPTQIPAGASNVFFSVSGAGFQPGASITFENGSGPSPQVSGVEVLFDTQITATISVSSGGRKGSRLWDVRVTNPDASTDVLPGALTVVK